MGTNMSSTQDGSLLEALLDSWDRNNAILINLLRAVPDGGMEARAADGSPTVAQLFMHIHYVRLVSSSKMLPSSAYRCRKVSGGLNATAIEPRRC